MAQPLIIKKYANRRLYDTARSRYITLPELAALVRAGTDVSVVDAQDGTDLTRAVLLQVLLEEQERLDLLPVELLHHIVRVQGTLHAAPFARWLTEAFGQWELMSRGLRGGLGGPVEAGAAALQGALKAVGLGAFASGWPGAGAGGATHAAPTDGAPGNVDPMDAVRSQMEDLLARLKRG